jgi:hypothetical protein
VTTLGRPPTARCCDCGDTFVGVADIDKYLRPLNWGHAHICHDCRIVRIRGRAGDGILGRDVRDANL